MIKEVKLHRMEMTVELVTKDVPLAQLAFEANEYDAMYDALKAAAHQEVLTAYKVAILTNGLSITEVGRPWPIDGSSAYSIGVVIS